MNSDDKLISIVVFIVGVVLVTGMFVGKGCTESRYAVQEAKWNAVQEAVKHDHVIIEKSSIISGGELLKKKTR